MVWKHGQLLNILLLVVVMHMVNMTTFVSCSYFSFLLSIRDVPISQKAISVAHYQPGDLGIIPKPDQYIPTYFEKMKDATAVQQLGSLKKVLTRSVGVQTISTQKVSGRDDYQSTFNWQQTTLTWQPPTFSWQLPTFNWQKSIFLLTTTNSTFNDQLITMNIQCLTDNNQQTHSMFNWQQPAYNYIILCSTDNNQQTPSMFNWW